MDIEKNRSEVLKKSYNLFNMHYINYNIGVLTGTKFDQGTLYAIEYNDSNVNHFRTLVDNIYSIDSLNYVYHNENKYYCFILSTEELGKFEKKRIYIDSGRFDNYAIFHCNNSMLSINIEN